MIEFTPDITPIPFEQEDPELGRLVAALARKIASIFGAQLHRPRPHSKVYYQAHWSREAGIGVNEKCPCGSDRKFKKCCIGT